jgi:MFS family permease
MIAPATVALSLQLDVPVKHIAQLSGYELLLVGALGPIVSVLAQKYGKRPQFLFATLFGVIGTGICIAGFDQTNLRKSYDVLLAGRLVQGIGTTAYESLSVAAIGDMFFLHERGLRTALLVLTLACCSSFVAIIAGTLFEEHGARNLFVVLLPLQMFNLVGAFLFLPETQFRRDIQTTAQMSSAEEVQENDGHAVAPKAVLKDDSGNVPLKRTFVQDLRLTSGMYTQISMLKLLGRIFVNFLNPAVLWIQLVSAVLVVRLQIPFYSTSFFMPNIYAVLPSRHNLHPSPNLHPTSLPPQRLPKWLLLHRGPTRRRARRVCRSTQRPPCQTPRETEQGRLRSRIPHSAVYYRCCGVCGGLVYVCVGTRSFGV